MELLVEDKNTDIVYDYSQIAEQVNFTSKMRGGSGVLTFSYHNGILLSSGSVVRFKYNEGDIFFGYVFKSSMDDDGKIQVTAYDQLRYFKSKELFPQDNLTLSGVVNAICTRFHFNQGEIEDSKHTLKDKAYSNKTLLDICYSGIDETLIETGKKYVLFDDFGEVKLKEAKNMRIELLLGDRSLAYGFNYSKSIDGKSYNRIKVLLKEEKNIKDFHVEKDIESMKKWGTLQHCEIVEKRSKVEMERIARDLLRLYNREEEKISIKCLGDTRVRGGSGIKVKLEDLGLEQWFMVNSVKHTFTNVYHTMDLELVI